MTADGRPRLPRQLASMVTGPRSIDFIVVGTPRSGTTLVQRLAGELPGVALPAETHFLSLLGESVIRRKFPLDANGLQDVVRDYLALPTSHGIEIDAETVVRCAGGGATSIFDVYSAIVDASTKPAATLGEKTPDHLLWWRPLTTHFPRLQVIWVVRDPRAVVASNLAVGWGMASPLLLAERWRHDQQQLVKAVDALGARCTVLRYEGVVSDPDRARGSIASALGLPDVTVPITADSPRIHEWETWKSGAGGSITEDRVDAWRGVLSPDQVRTVEVVCRKEMRLLGYAGTTSTLRGKVVVVTTSPIDHARRARFRLSRRRRLALIESAA